MNGAGEYSMTPAVPGRDHRIVPADHSAPIYYDVPEWMEEGLCAQTDPEAFFPDKGGSSREAKAICARCDVREQCLEYAIDHHERFGIYGGLSERERRAIWKARAA